MPKKFKFRLERVLEYREALRNEKKKELFLKNKALREAQERLAQLHSDLLNKSVISAGDIGAQELHLYADYEVRIRALIEETKNTILILTFEAEQAKEQYIEAVKEHEALKVLRMRKLSEYNFELDKAESKFVDELAVQRAGRIKKDQKIGSH